MNDTDSQNGDSKSIATRRSFVLGAVTGAVGGGLAVGAYLRSSTSSTPETSSSDEAYSRHRIADVNATIGDGDISVGRGFYLAEGLRSNDGDVIEADDGKVFALAKVRFDRTPTPADDWSLYVQDAISNHGRYNPIELSFSRFGIDDLHDDVPTWKVYDSDSASGWLVFEIDDEGTRYQLAYGAADEYQPGAPDAEFSVMYS